MQISISLPALSQAPARPGFMMVHLQEILYSTIRKQRGLYTTMELLWLSTLLNSTPPERTRTCRAKQRPS